MSRLLAVRTVALQGALLQIRLALVTNPAAILNAMRVVVRPVHQSAQFVPLVHAAKLNPVTDTDGHALG